MQPSPSHGLANGTVLQDPFHSTFSLKTFPDLLDLFSDSPVSIIALAAIIYYFAKKNLSKPTAYKLLRWILIFEGIYWLGLLTTGVVSVQSLVHMGLDNAPIMSLLRSLALSAIPSLVESIVPPIALFILASKLSPDKPAQKAIKWGLITGTIYIIVFWLTNTSMWFITLIYEKGTGYLTSYSQNLLSFILTTFGLLSCWQFTQRTLRRNPAERKPCKS